MTFNQAQKTLKKIAGDRYHVIRFEVTNFGHESQRQEVECAVYVDGSNWHTAPTWEEALALLKLKLNPTPAPAINKQSPKVDVPAPAESTDPTDPQPMDIFKCTKDGCGEEWRFEQLYAKDYAKDGHRCPVCGSATYNTKDER